jgi:hypothetical protein
VRDALNTLGQPDRRRTRRPLRLGEAGDLRFSKSLKLKGGSLEGMVDCFNMFNSSVVLRRVTTNGPNYNKPLSTGGIDAGRRTRFPRRASSG